MFDHKEYMKAYNQKHKQKMLDYKKQRRLENPEHYREIDRRYTLKRIKQDADYYARRKYLYSSIKKSKLKDNAVYYLFGIWKYLLMRRRLKLKVYLQQVHKSILNKYFYSWNLIILLRYRKVRRLVETYNQVQKENKQIGRPKKLQVEEHKPEIQPLNLLVVL